MIIANNDTTRLNLLMGLQYYFYEMTPNIGDCILDWTDPNPTENRSDGAKEDVYQGMSPPYHCKNGPFDTLDELLLVSNVTPQYVYGNDRNRNGNTLPADEDGNPPNQGWSNYLTVYSHEPNVDAYNNPRIWINDPNLQNLNTNIVNLGTQNSQYSSVAANAAQFVIAYRMYGGKSTAPPGGAMANANANANGVGGAQVQAQTAPPPPPYVAMPSADAQLVQTQINNDLSAGTNTGKNQITSLSALLTSTVSVTVQVSTGRDQSKSVTYVSPFNDPNQQQYILPLVYDELTTTNASDLTPRINVNTASYSVLTMLPNLSEQEIANIQAAQPINQSNGNDPTNPAYITTAWLITLANLGVLQECRTSSPTSPPTVACIAFSPSATATAAARFVESRWWSTPALVVHASSTSANSPSWVQGGLTSCPSLERTKPRSSCAGRQAP